MKNLIARLISLLGNSCIRHFSFKLDSLTVIGDKRQKEVFHWIKSEISAFSIYTIRLNFTRGQLLHPSSKVNLLRSPTICVIYEKKKSNHVFTLLLVSYFFWKQKVIFFFKMKFFCLYNFRANHQISNQSIAQSHPLYFQMWFSTYIFRRWKKLLHPKLHHKQRKLLK